MERNRPEANGQIKISLPGYELTIAPTERPQRLISNRTPRQDKAPLKGKQIEVNTKKLDINPSDYQVLDVLALQTFLRETTGVGEAEHSMEFEKKVTASMDNGGRVGKEDYLRVIQGIKKRSKGIKAADIAKVVVRRVPQMRSLNPKSGEYMMALSAITTAVEGFWVPDQKSKHRK